MPLFVMPLELWEFEGAGLLFDVQADSSETAVNTIIKVWVLDSEEWFIPSI